MNFSEFVRTMGWSDEEARLIKPFYLEDPALENVPAFAADEFIRRYWPLTGYHEDILPLAAEFRKHLTPEICVYLNLRYRWLYIDQKEPELLKIRPLKKFHGLASLLLALAALPLIEAKHKALGLPQKMLAGTGDWIGNTIDNFRQAHHGEFGHDLRQTHWLIHSVNGKLFRIGRFEYLLHNAPEWLPAIYENKQTGKVIALCRDGWELNAQGLRSAGKDRVAKVARLRWSEQTVTGIWVNPRGFAESTREITLDLEEYRPLLCDHEYVPSVHIPGGGKMTLELARQSLRAAAEFFEQYFEYEIKAFVCGSWILNPAFERELPESNLAQLMRQFYLFPGWPEAKSGLFFVFGTDEGEFGRDYPADNSLRQAFHRIWEAEHIFRSGGMFVLTRDLEKFGTQFYRNHQI